MANSTRAVSLQTGIRQYNGNLSKYSGMLGGLTPDIHTLRSLNPETTNRVITVMYRGPYFLMRYFATGSDDRLYTNTDFATYKKMIEYYNTGITPNIGEGTLSSTALQGGFAGRSIPIPTTQNTQSSQTLTFSVPELVGRPVSNFHNMWVDGISDAITGLTTYHGLVCGSVDSDGIAHRVFYENDDEKTDVALEPSPAWEVAEFLVIALDRSGARVEGAVAALGCTPASKVGNQEIFTSNGQGSSSIQTLSLVFNCQFIQSAYINDLASRYVNQFAIFGNSLNYNPGAGDAFFTDTSSKAIDTGMFNNGQRPSRDGVQSALGNAPVMTANSSFDPRKRKGTTPITPTQHYSYYNTDSSDPTNPDKEAVLGPVISPYYENANIAGGGERYENAGSEFIGGQT